VEKMLKKIAVLLTVHNRIDLTLRCLKALKINEKYGEYSFSIIVYDDKSSDGTPEKLLANFTNVSIIHGTGSAYWSGGMRKAFNEAYKNHFDYFLWLNNDTFLHKEALTLLFNSINHSLENFNEECIAVGVTQDPISKKINYGGYKLSGNRFFQNLKLITQLGSYKLCDTFNGNCVLIPRNIAINLKNIDKQFIHSLGDFDYGLRAKEKSIKSFTTKEPIGTCSSNSKEFGVGYFDRLKSFFGPKYLPPKPWFVYLKRHGRMLWIIQFMVPYIYRFLNIKRNL